MATTFTPNLKLSKPATNDRGWDAPILATINAIDAASPIGSLAVTLHEVPSSTLNVAVAAGTFVNQANAYQAVSAVASLAMTASATTYIWATNAGTVTTGSAWPSAGTKIVRLAIVVAGASTITSITDARVAMVSAG